MEADIILKIAGIGVLVFAAYLVLSRAGREEQATLVSIAGIILVLFIILEQIGDLFDTVRRMFSL